MLNKKPKPQSKPKPTPIPHNCSVCQSPAKHKRAIIGSNNGHVYACDDPFCQEQADDYADTV